MTKQRHSIYSENAGGMTHKFRKQPNAFSDRLSRIKGVVQNPSVDQTRVEIKTFVIISTMARLLLVVLFSLGLSAGPPQTPPLPRTVNLEQAIQEALNHNLDLLAERYNLSLAETRMITARLRPNPVASLGYNYIPIPGTGFNYHDGVGPTEWNSRVDFILERGGKRNRRIELARQDREVSELGVQDTIRGIIFAVQSSFVDIQLAKESLVLAQDNLKAFQGIVDVNTARVNAGDLARVELTRIQVAALQFQNAVQQNEMQLNQAKIRLQQLLGRPAGQPDFDIEGDIRRDTTTYDVTQLQSLAQSNRPDIQEIQASQARSQADIRLQIAQGKVDYSVGAQYSYQRVNPGTGNTVSVFFSAPLPVFNRNQGEILRAQRESDQLIARLKAIQNSVDAEVRSAYQGYLTNRNLLQNIETNMVNQAKDVRRITEYSYRRGEASLVELLDAQRAFNDTMQSYNQARADFARSLFLLDSVTGQQAK